MLRFNPPPTTLPFLPLASLRSGLETRLENAEAREAAFAKGIADAISRIRESVFDTFPLSNLQLPMLPAEYVLADRIGGVRDVLRGVLQEERIWGTALLLGCISLSIFGGSILGDRANPPKVTMATKEAPDLRRSLSRSAARAFDEGRDAAVVENLQQQRRPPPPQRELDSASAGGRPYTAVSNLQWAQLLLCILLDVAGDASFFYPLGEAWDLPFAVVSSYAVQLVFDWPALSLLNFLEEALPLTDVLPSATFGWLCVVVLGLRPQMRSRVSRMASGRRLPISDRRSYQPPEAYFDPDLD